MIALADLIREHSEALEYDLIRAGLRLRDVGSRGFNWRDLFVIARRLGRDSEIYRDLHPDDDPSWSVSDYLLATLVDTGNLRLWQAGGSKGKKPAPYPRPEDVKRQRGDAMTIEEATAWLGW